MGEVGAVVAAVVVDALVDDVDTALVAVPPVLVDIGSELPCCPAVWNKPPRNCCRAAATEAPDVGSVEAVDVALEPVEDASLDDVNPSCDSAAEIACSSGFVPALLLVDVVDEESAVLLLCWFARVR